MAKIKFTKGELKRERDSLRQYERYLPTLQLKKQQLQMEIIRQRLVLEEKRSDEARRVKDALAWAGLLTDTGIDITKWVRPLKILKGSRNIAGVGLPVFEKAEFAEADYDLFLSPLWADAGIDALKTVAALREEAAVIEEAIAVTKRELRITTQRVNLFEKVKIPEALEAIRRIKIYIGDQMANAVGRSKIAKRKIEEAVSDEAEMVVV